MLNNQPMKRCSLGLIGLFIAWTMNGTLGEKNQPGDFYTSKLMQFFEKTDVNGNGILEFQDYHLIAECFIENIHHDNEKATHLRKKTVPHAWNSLTFDKHGKGSTVAEEEFISTLTMRRNQPEFLRALRSFLPVFLDGLLADKDGLTYEKFVVLYNCRNTDLGIARSAFDRADVDGNGRISDDEWMAAGLDFFNGGDENGIGAYLLGKLKE